jgi:hypothetical protein
MRILCTQQNTDEWELARKGRVTASMIDKVLAAKHTKGRFEYMMNLIMDLEGVADFKDEAPWFLKGKKYERDALGWYQNEANCVVHQTGFVLHDEYNWFGCSPDGLVGNDGMVEMKYRSTPTTFETARTKPLSRAYDYQMQAQMGICNRKWIHYVNYYRNESGSQEQGHIRFIERDDGKIRELEEAAMLFWQETVRKWKKRSGKEFISFPFDSKR